MAAVSNQLAYTITAVFLLDSAVRQVIPRPSLFPPVALMLTFLGIRTQTPFLQARQSLTSFFSSMEWSLSW